MRRGWATAMREEQNRLRKRVIELENENASLRDRLADAELRASMACEQEPCGDCPGCACAREHYETERIAE